METLQIIGVVSFLAVATALAVYVSTRGSKKKKEEEPAETRSCVLCNHTSEAYTKLAPYECCERIAVVCTICEREAGDKLEARVKEWHAKLFCPESIAAEPIFGKMEAAEKAAVEEMFKRPDALHEANMNAAQLHRAEKVVKAELTDKLQWAENLVANLATEEERKSLWIVLSNKYSNEDLTKAVEHVVRHTA
jgi:hypothetical protein